MSDDKRLKIGYNTFAGLFGGGKGPMFGPLEQSGGVDFLFVHFDPQTVPVSESKVEAAAVAREIANRGTEFIANFEFQNFQYLTKAPDGTEWSNRLDGTHRLILPEGYVDALASAGNLAGLTYDEFEHCIINNNLSIYLDKNVRKVVPVFPVPDTADFETQRDTLNGQIKEFADSIRAAGAPAFSGEHVFPVLFHMFARNGIVPNFKSQKEGWSNIHFAVAAGAALQYGMPLWNCVDLWHIQTFPGHSASEMFYNLVFAYKAGVNRTYVEAANAFYDGDEYNEYGRTFSQFVKLYRGRERDYDISDYEPEIAIIKPDDGYWGQGRLNIMWKDSLLGNRAIKSKKEDREFIDAFRIITHGETVLTGISWDKISPWTIAVKHRSFCTMNGAAVFDEYVRRDKLGTAKLIFLCGRTLSAETLADVRSVCAENGTVVVCPSRFAPADILADARSVKMHASYSEVRVGRGSYIVTDNLRAPDLASRLSEYLGRKGEIKLKFAGKTVRMKISDNGNRID
ncbi:MAG: hypothetical protein IJM45_01745 [Clostridia bacterium]|nr:hypothetical protein [Clostridia bacterium]